jgi:hypothetical protein
MKGWSKPVLVCALLSLPILVLGEGSGETLSDLEDLLGLDDDEGSGEWGMLNPVRDNPSDPSLIRDSFEYDIHFSQTDLDLGSKQEDLDKDDDLEYYDDMYPEDYEEFLQNYDDDDSLYDEPIQGTEDSVLKIDEKPENDIEIRPKPGAEDGEEIIIETSQIFIMVGSAFVSFAVVMLTFFLCKRMISRKQEKKRIPFTISAPEKKILKESSIVKDYQKVPTTTQEFLQNSHIDMYGERTKAAENPAAEPLVE